MKEMILLDGMDFSEVPLPFMEDPEQELRRILEKYKGQETPNGFCPMVFRDQMTEDDSKMVEQLYREVDRRLEKKAARQENVVDSPSATGMIPQVQIPHVPNIMDRLFQQNALCQQAGREQKPAPMNLMNVLLSRVIFRKYKGDFYYFEENVYRRLPNSELQDFVFHVLYQEICQDGSPRLLANVATLLQHNPTIRVFNTTDSGTQIYFQNGALDLVSNTLRPVSPADFFTSYIAVDFPVGMIVPTPIFDGALHIAFGGDDTCIQTLLEMVGYFLIPGNQAKSFFVLQGVGNSGKSVLGSLIGELFNEEAVSHLDIFRLGGRFDVSALRRVRLNISMDLANGCLNRQAMSVIKSITGDDGIPLEGKFKDVEFSRVSCKLLFGSNHKLTLSEHDEAFLARLVVIPFRYAIPEEHQDKKLLDKLRLEKSGIVQKALAAYRQLASRNFRFLLGCGDIACGRADGGELIWRFLEEACVFEEGAVTPTSILYQAFRQFCEVLGIESISNSSSFSRQLNAFCMGRIQNRKKRVGGISMNCYFGIRLKNADEVPIENQAKNDEIL